MDVSALVVAVSLAEAGASRAGVPPAPALVLLGYSGLVLAILALRGMYRPRLSLTVLDDFRGILTTTALASMVVLSMRVFLIADPAAAAQTARLWAFSTAFVIGGRAVLYWSELSARQAAENLAPTLIVGAGRVGRLTARRLLERREFGLRPVGFLDKDPAPSDEPLPVPVLGASWDLDDVVEKHHIQHVILTFSTAPTDVMLRLGSRCEELGIGVGFVPRFFERMTERLTVHHLGGLPVFFARPANPRGWQFEVKYALDRVLAALLLLLAAPVLIVAALAVLVTMGRPVLFGQHRVGRDGREFRMLKLRTMRGSPDEAGEADAEWAARELGSGALVPDPAEDDRRTPLGRLLRRASIDELPQLINVLRGEMSLVGPRPERTQYVRLFEPSVYRYGDRHRVKSGVTGWAQVSGLRGNTSLRDRAEWDNWYIENWSPWLDVKVLLLTIVAVARGVRTAE